MNEEMVEATVRVPKMMWKGVGMKAVDLECSKAEIVRRAIDLYLWGNRSYYYNLEEN